MRLLNSPQLLFGLTLLTALLCFGVMFDQLADAIEASQPAEVELFFNPQAEPGRDWSPL